MRAISPWIATALLLISATAGAAGFDAQYTVRAGHYDVDGLVDLYVSSTRGTVVIPVDDIPIVIPPAVAPFVLRNSGNGTFSLVTTLTAAQRSTMQAWPVAAADLSLRDVDVNGADDLTIASLDPIVSGAFDQIVFAQRPRGRAPIQVTPKNAKFLAYHEDISRWLRNINYFTNVPKKLTSAQPATPVWYGFVGDPRDFATLFAVIAECNARFPTRVCAYTSIDPTPNSVDNKGCVRPVILRDQNLNPIGTDPSHNVCQYDAHIYVYIPSQVTVVADANVYDPDAKETADVIRRLRENCPLTPLLTPQQAHEVEVILGEIYGQNIFLDPGRGPINVANNVSHPPAPGDGAFNMNDPTFHHYDVQTTMCTLGAAGCDVTHLSNLLRRYTYPSFRLQPKLTSVNDSDNVLAYFSVTGSWSPNNYLWPIGFVTQHFVASPPFWADGIQNVTQPTHLVYPGTITRKVMLNGNSFEVFTHGIGINRAFCSVYNQPFDLPVQMIVGFGNDVGGAAAFRALDKQMRLQYQSNPTGLPSGSGGQQKPGQDEAHDMLSGTLPP